MSKRVWIVMGSDSDLKVMSEAAKVLEEFGVDFRMTIASAHRCPDQVLSMSRSAREDGFGVIIAGAGLAAHLPGVVASSTTLPVIGIPLKSGALAGTDALYAVVQMPPGVPVATVAIDGAKNAGLLAVQMLGINDSILSEKLAEHKAKMAKDVQAKDARLQELGYRGYLSS